MAEKSSFEESFTACKLILSRRDIYNTHFFMNARFVHAMTSGLARDEAFAWIEYQRQCWLYSERYGLQHYLDSKFYPIVMPWKSYFYSIKRAFELRRRFRTCGPWEPEFYDPVKMEGFE